MAKKRKASEWGDRLRTARKRRKLRQDDVANLFRVSRQSIVAWERGKTIPLPSMQLLIELFEDGTI